MLSKIICSIILLMICFSATHSQVRDTKSETKSDTKINIPLNLKIIDSFNAINSNNIKIYYSSKDIISETIQNQIENHISKVDGKLNLNYEIHVSKESSSIQELNSSSINTNFESQSQQNLGQTIDYSIETVTNSQLVTITIRAGNTFSILSGIYHVLNEFGVLRMHPLETHYIQKESIKPINLHFVSKYEKIGTHLHTMHPLELTDMLNGYIDHSLKIGDFEDFSSIVDKNWNKFLEWMVSSKTNMLEWVLLRANSNFDKSDQRIKRLQLLVDRAHDYGIFVGVDVPIALQQQHSWALIETFGDRKKESEQIQKSVSLLNNAHFDFISTEIGFSEFTHGNVSRMLEWLDELTQISKDLGMKTYTKCHISTGQVEKGWIDPVTKKDGMNFNFLPYYASKDLGIYPHTVQYYSFDDPANTYGNSNFTNMLKYLEVELGRREIIYFPETAYWVNYDINVPLFLPLYIDRRLYDLRLIAQIEKNTGKKINGHIIFSSGWEFGYWLNDKVVNEMVASPDSIDLNRSHDEDLRIILKKYFINFGDEATQNSLTDIMLELIIQQREYLIYGTVDGKRPINTLKRSGQSYLEGWDTWSDVMGYITTYFGKNVATQPDGLRIIQVRNGLDEVLPGPKYREISPLLSEMKDTFNTTFHKFKSLSPAIHDEVRDLFDDLADSIEILSLRAAQVYETFEYAYAVKRMVPDSELEIRRISILSIMKEAGTVMDRRVSNFRAENIGSWNTNPTAYKFYYLFHARTLFFWWRDIGQAFFNVISPCYMNVINPVDVSLGEGFLSELAEMVRKFLDMMKKAEWIAECLGAPSSEPKIPPFPI